MMNLLLARTLLNGAPGEGCRRSKCDETTHETKRQCLASPSGPITRPRSYPPLFADLPWAASTPICAFRRHDEICLETIPERCLASARQNPAVLTQNHDNWLKPNPPKPPPKAPAGAPVGPSSKLNELRAQVRKFHKSQRRPRANYRIRCRRIRTPPRAASTSSPSPADEPALIGSHHLKIPKVLFPGNRRNIFFSLSSIRLFLRREGPRNRKRPLRNNFEALPTPNIPTNSIPFAGRRTMEHTFYLWICRTAAKTPRSSPLRRPLHLAP